MAPFVVKVATDKPEAGVGIDWSLTNQPAGGNASLSSGSSSTDSDGIASATLKLGKIPGVYTSQAVCPECAKGNPQEFTATAVCPEADTYDYKQGGDSTWANEPYDKWCSFVKDGKTIEVTCDYDTATGALKTGYTARTIKQEGCALASTAMVLKRYDYAMTDTGEYVNPVNLNGLANETADGYVGKGAFNFSAVADYSAPQLDLVYRRDTTRDKNNKWIPLDKSLMDSYLERCIPVIVQVDSSTNSSTNKAFSSHFVVVTAKSGSDYTINDPGWSGITKLSHYGNIYKIRVLEDKKARGCK